MTSCPSPGLSAVSSTAAVFAGAFALASGVVTSPLMRFSDAWASLRIDCEGVRWSGVVCFCRAIARDSGRIRLSPLNKTI